MELKALEKELIFKMSRSSGKGGQHVNKVSTRVSLLFDIPNSKHLDLDQKNQILAAFPTRISQDGILQLSCQKTRSQFQNKQFAIQKFYNLIEQALQPKKIRKKRRISAAVKLKRRKEKQFQSEKKNRRKKFEGYKASELFSI